MPRQPKSVECPPLRGSDVRRGNHPHATTSTNERLDVLVQHAQPVPFHEGAEEIDTIRKTVGPDDNVVCGLSGGVDSAVAAALLHEPSLTPPDTVLRIVDCAGRRVHAFEPWADRPRPGIALTRHPVSDRHRNRDREMRSQPGQPFLVLVGLRRRPGTPGEADEEVVTESVQGVVRARGRNPPDAEVCPPRELGAQQPANEIRVGGPLVGVHAPLSREQRAGTRAMIGPCGTGTPPTPIWS